MKARIQKADETGALWLFIDRDDNRLKDVEEVSEIMFDLHIKDEGNVAWALLDDEVEVVRDACNEWLNTNKNQSGDITKKVEGE